MNINGIDLTTYIIGDVVIKLLRDKVIQTHNLPIIGPNSSEVWRPEGLWLIPGRTTSERIAPGEKSFRNT